MRAREATSATSFSRAAGGWRSSQQLFQPIAFKTMLSVASTVARPECYPKPIQSWRRSEFRQRLVGGTAHPLDQRRSSDKRGRGLPGLDHCRVPGEGSQATRAARAQLLVSVAARYKGAADCYGRTRSTLLLSRAGVRRSLHLIGKSIQADLDSFDLCSGRIAFHLCVEQLSDARQELFNRRLRFISS